MSYRFASGLLSVTAGTTATIDTAAKHSVGQIAVDQAGRLWVYMQGVASCLEGSFVTYDEAGVTTLLAANAKGPVAVAGAALVAATYGWFCVFATAGVQARLAANCADNALIGRETTDGLAGDGRAAGDEIYNAITRGSTAGAAALAAVQIMFPHVDDANGA